MGGRHKLLYRVKYRIRKNEIRSDGKTSFTGTTSCDSISSSIACIVPGNVRIKNASPWADLNLGNVDVGGSSGSLRLVFGKNYGGEGFENFQDRNY